MFALLIVIVLLVGALIVSLLRLLSIINTDDDTKITSFFKKYLHVIFIGLFLIYGILTVLSLINLTTLDHLYILVIKIVVEIIYFAIIYKNSIKLLKNIEDDIIFNNSNVKYIQTIAKQFIYLTAVELFGGLILGVFDFMISYEFKSFTLQTNSVIFLYLAIGLILLIVSAIFKKAIVIAEENELTI